MTIPTRPAPAPPGPRGLNAAAGANASLEQLRMQFQEQQQHHHHQHHQSYQQQNGGVQKLTIKLPPPPNSRHNGAATPLANLGMQQKNYNNNNANQNNYNANNNNGTNGSSITRKFPQANVRYAPTTSWDGLPFEPTASSVTSNSGGSGFKKVPPPRPPPPKVQFSSSKKTTAPAPPQSVNILNNIFNRKKSVKAPAPSSAKDGQGGRRTPAGVYGTSSGNYGTTIASSTTATTHINNSSYGAFNSSSWGGSSSTAFSSYSSSTTTTITQQDAQLISFDSPPSSPTFTQKSNSDCVSVDSFSSDSNFSSPHNGSVSQPESGFEDDFTARSRSTTSPLDPWETLNAFSNTADAYGYASTATIGTAPVRNLSSINTRIQSSNDNPLCNGKSLLPPAPSVTAPTIIKPKISQKPKAPKPPVLKQNFQNSNTAAAAFDDLPTPPSPPMPQCAPPPPPPALSGAGGGSAQISLLDVITGKVDALQLAQSTSYELEQAEPPHGYALYDFDGVEDGDLSFRENEKIYLLEQVSDEWYRGRTRNGCEGIFPSNYIDIRIPLAVPSQKNTTTTTTISPALHTPAHNATANAYEIPKVRCLYNFPAEVAGDLALRENDMVTILYKINEDWLYGSINGREGQFPANFLEYLPANIPMP